MKPRIRLRHRQRTATQNVLIASVALIGITFFTIGAIFFFNLGDVRNTKGAALVSVISSGNWTDSSIWSTGVLPSSLDDVLIEDGFVVTLDVNASCASLTVTAPMDNGASQFIIGDNQELTLSGNVVMNGGTSNKRDASIIFNNDAKLTILGDFTVNSASVKRANLEMTGQNAILNIAGAFTVNSELTISGGIVNFNGVDMQVFPAASGVTFSDVHFNNTSTEGIRLDGAITKMEVSGNIKIESGILDNEGFEISGKTGKSFEVAAGAQLLLEGSSAFPSKFNAYLNENSTVKYLGIGNQTIESLQYGNLILNNMGTKTLPTGEALSIAGDFTCSSSTSIDSNSTVLFNGRFPQYILGDSSIIFKKITLANIRGLALNNSIIVDELLTLTAGTLTTSLTDILIFNPPASVAGGTDSSYINGPAIKNTISTASFKFPLGKSNAYRPVVIEPTNSYATSFTAEYFDASYQNTSSLGAGLDHISVLEYFQIDRFGDANAKVGLSWDDRSAVEGAYIQDLRVAKWDGSVWQDMGNSSFSGDSSYGMVWSDVVASFSPFTIGSVSQFNPLPIELLSFNAEPVDRSVILTWETASESNNDFFTVERSVDGKSFQTIGHVPGAGTSNTRLAYRTEDDNPAKGLSFYRLKQTDYDGQFEYFKVVPIEFEEDVIAQTIRIAPNPFSSQFKLDFTLNREEQVDFFISSIDGQTVHHELIEASAGDNQFNFSGGAHLSTGVYFVNVLGDNTRLTVKAVKN